MLTQYNVPQNLIIHHLYMPKGNIQIQHLLQLELDHRADFGEFIGEIFVGNGGGNLLAADGRVVRKKAANEEEKNGMQCTFGQTRPEETRDLFDEGFRSEEGIVFLREVFHELLVLIQPSHQNELNTVLNSPLEIVYRHILEVDLLGVIYMSGIG